MHELKKQILIKEIEAYLPDKFKLDLDLLIDDMVHSEMDIVIVLDGKEGTGKSWVGRLIGKYISYRCGTEFNDKNIHFNGNDYIEFSENNKKFTANVLDESREALNKRRSTSKSNVKFTSWLSENRDKHQAHILILPAVHDLDSYVSVWRMSLLVHMLKKHKKTKKSLSGYELVRGYFKVFSNSKDLQLNMWNKAKYGYYSYPKIPKYMRKFKYCEVFTKEELEDYKNKKSTKRHEKYVDEQAKATKKDFAMGKMIQDMILNGKTKTEIAALFKVNRKSVNNWIETAESGRVVH